MAQLDWRTATVAEVQARMTADPGLFGRIHGEFVDTFNAARGFNNPAYAELDREQLGFQQRMAEAGSVPARLLVLLEARDHFLKRKAEWEDQRKRDQQAHFQRNLEGDLERRREAMRQDFAAVASAPLNAVCQELSAGIAAVQGKLTRIAAEADLVPLIDELEAALRVAGEAVKAERKAIKGRSIKEAA
jgi:hypothetical protein